MLWLAGCFLCAADAAPQSGFEDYGRPQRLVRLPDGRRLNLYCTGSGSPTVILEGGWGTETLYWRKVQPALAEVSRVCSYDRAGYGYSDPGPMPRTASNDERDLDALLRAASIAQPVILVAHSLGSLDAQLFADQHPDRVAGLILLDPTTPEAERDLQSFVDAAVACSRAVEHNERSIPDRDLCLGSPAADLPESVNRARLNYQMTAAYQQAGESEIASILASAREVQRSRRAWGRLPLIVITASEGDTDPKLSDKENEKIRAAHWAAQEQIAALSTRHVHRLLKGASHFIPMEHPEAVIEAVGEVRGMIRR